ncbi:hypothetical protein [Brevibacillus choshinensis]|uniref:hypothetical protein n=1 Tax=Brevibacillus choshinensis TaxID=54911 RepID=UPI002E222249|nr:hypothetical protein [Brevibacillus choshinensis]
MLVINPYTMFLFQPRTSTKITVNTTRLPSAHYDLLFQPLVFTLSRRHFPLSLVPFVVATSGYTGQAAK